MMISEFRSIPVASTAIGHIWKALIVCKVGDISHRTPVGTLPPGDICKADFSRDSKRHINLAQTETMLPTPKWLSLRLVADFELSQTRDDLIFLYEK